MIAVATKVHKRPCAIPLQLGLLCHALLAFLRPVTAFLAAFLLLVLLHSAHTYDAVAQQHAQEATDPEHAAHANCARCLQCPINVRSDS